MNFLFLVVLTATVISDDLIVKINSESPPNAVYNWNGWPAENNISEVIALYDHINNVVFYKDMSVPACFAEDGKGSATFLKVLSVTNLTIATEIKSEFAEKFCKDLPIFKIKTSGNLRRVHRNRRSSSNRNNNVNTADLQQSRNGHVTLASQTQTQVVRTNNGYYSGYPSADTGTYLMSQRQLPLRSQPQLPLRSQPQLPLRSQPQLSVRSLPVNYYSPGGVLQSSAFGQTWTHGPGFRARIVKSSSIGKQYQYPQSYPSQLDFDSNGHQNSQGVSRRVNRGSGHHLDSNGIQIANAADNDESQRLPTGSDGPFIIPDYVSNGNGHLKFILENDQSQTFRRGGLLPEDMSQEYLAEGRGQKYKSSSFQQHHSESIDGAGSGQVEPGFQQLAVTVPVDNSHSHSNLQSTGPSRQFNGQSEHHDESQHIGIGERRQFIAPNTERGEAHVTQQSAESWRGQQKFLAPDGGGQSVTKVQTHQSSIAGETKAPLNGNGQKGLTFRLSAQAQPPMQDSFSHYTPLGNNGASKSQQFDQSQNGRTYQSGYTRTEYSSPNGLPGHHDLSQQHSSQQIGLQSNEGLVQSQDHSGRSHQFGAQIRPTYHQPVLLPQPEETEDSTYQNQNGRTDAQGSVYVPILQLNFPDYSQSGAAYSPQSGQKSQAGSNNGLLQPAMENIGHSETLEHSGQSVHPNQNGYSRHYTKAEQQLTTGQGQYGHPGQLPPQPVVPLLPNPSPQGSATNTNGRGTLSLQQNTDHTFESGTQTQSQQQTVQQYRPTSMLNIPNGNMQLRQSNYPTQRPGTIGQNGKCHTVTFNCTVVNKSNGRAKLCRPTRTYVNGSGLTQQAHFRPQSGVVGAPGPQGATGAGQGQPLNQSITEQQLCCYCC